jgi:hypothetical protein
VGFAYNIGFIQLYLQTSFCVGSDARRDMGAVNTNVRLGNAGEFEQLCNALVAIAQEETKSMSFNW